jgi:hypothetical protein
MTAMRDTAAKFFDACETGQGWEACESSCHPDASFSAQADAFKEIETIEGYPETMKGLLPGPRQSPGFPLDSLGSLVKL